MYVHFWGTRGSIPISITPDVIRRKIRLALEAALACPPDKDRDIDGLIHSLPFSVQGTYGSNTACVEIREKGAGTAMICDAGSGLRDLGNHMMASRASRTDPIKADIFISHPHWDHLSGFPFFTPAYVPGNQIRIFGCHRDLEASFHRQQNGINFPVPLSEMAADISFHTLDPDQTYEFNGFQVRGIRQNHPGTSYGWRFEKQGKTVVYSTDAEHHSDADHHDYAFVDFFRNADLLVFDSQYRFADAVTARKNWGHSNNMVAVELAMRARVKQLCLFHNEPTFDDATLEKVLQESKRYADLCPDPHALVIHMGYDGLGINI